MNVYHCSSFTHTLNKQSTMRPSHYIKKNCQEKWLSRIFIQPEGLYYSIKISDIKSAMNLDDILSKTMPILGIWISWFCNKMLPYLAKNDIKSAWASSIKIYSRYYMITIDYAVQEFLEDEKWFLSKLKSVCVSLNKKSCRHQRLEFRSG